MTPHRWKESSGTTHTCQDCGCVRVNAHSSYNPTTRDLFTQRRADGTWTDTGEKLSAREPDCAVATAKGVRRDG